MRTLALAVCLALASPALAQDRVEGIDGPTYQVMRGDTLGFIASYFPGISARDLARANRIGNANALTQGETLVIPTGDRKHKRFFVYLAREGDFLADGVTVNLSVVAARVGLHVSVLEQLKAKMEEMIPNVEQRRIQAVPGKTIIPLHAAAVQSVLNGNTPEARPAAPGASQHLSDPTTSPAPTGRWWNRLPAHTRDLRLDASQVEYLARVIKGECPANMPHEGKVAVGCVVIARTRSRHFPRTIKAVVTQRKQFSSYNPNERGRLFWGGIPPWCWLAARDALLVAGTDADPSGAVDHYFNPFIVAPGWARPSGKLYFLARVGAGTVSDTVQALMAPEIRPHVDRLSGLMLQNRRWGRSIRVPSATTLRNQLARSGISVSTASVKRARWLILSTTHDFHRWKYKRGTDTTQPLPAPTQPVRPALQPSVEASSNGLVTTHLRLRSGPSTRTRTLGILSPAERLEILATQDGWLRVRTSRGQGGYVAARFVAQGDAGMTTASRLRVRAQPGGRHIASVERHTVIRILARSNGWLEVQAKGRRGFVSAEYVITAAGR